MSVFIFPLWIFSGALFPAEGTPQWMSVIISLNPLTYGMQLIRGCFIDTGMTNMSHAPVANSITPLGGVYLVMFGMIILFYCSRLIARGK
jgi:ABC-2 type transport system permease protein